MIWVDTDCAMGSPWGDVDDGFALALLFAAQAPIVGISTVFGNTSADRAKSNCESLISCFQSSMNYQKLTTVIGGAKSAKNLSTFCAHQILSTASQGNLRILALGPLTNIAAVLNQKEAKTNPQKLISEVVIVGTNSSSIGRWPPIWPHEFNLTHDIEATRTIYESPLELTIIPLNQAYRLYFQFRNCSQSKIGKHLTRKSIRWMIRSLLIRGSTKFPIWDLVAAAYAVQPQFFEFTKTPVKMHKNCRFEYGTGERSVKLLKNYDVKKVWNYFIEQIR